MEVGLVLLALVDVLLVLVFVLQTFLGDFNLPQLPFTGDARDSGSRKMESSQKSNTILHK